MFSCRCGRLQEKRTCAQRDFSCGKKCGRELSCGGHSCERLCHGGECGDCPLSGKASVSLLVLQSLSASILFLWLIVCFAFFIFRDGLLAPLFLEARFVVPPTFSLVSGFSIGRRNQIPIFPLNEILDSNPQNLCSHFSMKAPVPTSDLAPVGSLCWASSQATPLRPAWIGNKLLKKCPLTLQSTWLLLACP